MSVWTWGGTVLLLDRDHCSVPTSAAQSVVEQGSVKDGCCADDGLLTLPGWPDRVEAREGAKPHRAEADVWELYQTLNTSLAVPWPPVSGTISWITSGPIKGSVLWLPRRSCGATWLPPAGGFMAPLLAWCRSGSARSGLLHGAQWPLGRGFMRWRRSCRTRSSGLPKK